MKLGPRYFLRGVELVRGAEWPAAINRMGLEPQHRILDIGSAGFSLLPLWLADHGYQVHITDIDKSVFKHMGAVNRLSDADNPARLRTVMEVQDARALTYDDNSFDRVFAISTLEHIGGDGDMQAMREIGRVLKPGGLAAVSVPFRAGLGGAPLSEYVDSGEVSGYGADIGIRQLFRRRKTGTPVFFQYRYSYQAWRSRLYVPSGLRYVGDAAISMRVDVRKLWAARPAWLKAGTNWLTPLVTAATVRDDEGDEPITGKPWKPEAIVLILRKPTS
jgi:SAM-dependent methyltransferase